MKTLNIVLLCLLASCLFAQEIGVSTITEEFPGSGGVKIGPDGYLYIANFGQELDNPDGTQVWRLDLQTGERTLFASGLAGASGNAFDSQGNLFQSNIAGNRVSKITPNGTVSTFSNIGLVNPVGITIDADDNLYVCNCGDHTIRKITAAGDSQPFASGDIFKCPNGITIDSEGNLYVSNFNNGNVIKITPDGTPTLLADIPGGNNGHLTYFEPDNVLFVNSHGSSSLYRLTLTGEVTKIAGSGIRGNVDGTALQARFSRPNGIAVSSTGDTIFLNSSIPIQDNPAISYWPLNPSIVRMITGLNPANKVTNSEVVIGQLQLYPNPASDQLLVDLTLKKSMRGHWILLDANGKAVQQSTVQAWTAGKHHLVISVGILSPGQYYFSFKGNLQGITKPVQIGK